MENLKDTKTYKGLIEKLKSDYKFKNKGAKLFLNEMIRDEEIKCEAELAVSNFDKEEIDDWTSEYSVLLRKFDKLSCKDKVNILYNAVKYAGQFHNWGISDCIVMAMAKNYEDGIKIINNKII